MKEPSLASLIALGALYAAVGADPEEAEAMDAIVAEHPRPRTPAEAMKIARDALRELREGDET